MKAYCKSNLLPAIETWDAWAKIFTNLHVWKPAIHKICQREAIPITSIKPGYPGTNAVFIVNQDTVVKIYAPFCHDDYHLERELLSELGKNTLIPAPKIIAKGLLEDQISWPYIIMEFLPGQPIREVRKRIEHQNLMELTYHMGKIVREIHRTPLSALIHLDRSQKGWQRYTKYQVTNMEKKMQRRHTLPETVISKIPLYVYSELAKHREDKVCQLTLVHGDLTEDHWLLHKNQGVWSISGLLDFADAKISPRTYEWAALWFGALGQNHSSLSSFMQGYNPAIKIDESFYKHAMAYTFLHEFGVEIIEYILPEHIRRQIQSIDHLLQVLWGQEASERLL